MAIKSVGLIDWGGGGDCDLQKRQTTRQYKITYQVISDTYLDGPLTICQAIDPSTGLSIPQPGDIYSCGNDYDPTARCVKAWPSRQKKTQSGLVVWYVPCEYTSKVRDSDKSTFANPLAAPCEYTWGTKSITEVAEIDANGTAIVNSAGQKFNPPLEREKQYLTITVKKNVAYIDDSVIPTYINRINSAPFWGHAIGCVWLTDFSCSTAEIQKEDKTCRYGVVSITFAFNDEYWTDKNNTKHYGWHSRAVLDEGVVYKDAMGKITVATDANGNIHTEKILLDGSGKKLAEGSNPVYLPKQLLYTANFNNLLLTQPWQVSEV